METFGSDIHSHQPQEENHSHISAQNLLEEATNLSPSKEQSDLLLEAANHIVHPDSHIPDLDSQGQHFQHHDEPVQDDLHNNFDFGKELPSLPSDEHKNQDDLLMNFSTSHFRADDHPQFGDSPNEEFEIQQGEPELPKQSEDISEQDLMHEDVKHEPVEQHEESAHSFNEDLQEESYGQRHQEDFHSEPPKSSEEDVPYGHELLQTEQPKQSKEDNQPLFEFNSESLNPHEEDDQSHDEEVQSEPSKPLVDYEQPLQEEKVKPEPVFQASQESKVEDIPIPATSHVPTPKPEEIVITPPTHRPAPPIPVDEEPFQPSPVKSEAVADTTVNSTKVTSSPSPSKKSAVGETGSATKTRSVRSTKTETTITGSSFFGGWINFPRLNAYVTDLVYWRDTRKSGIVLGAILAILLSLSVVSVVSVISYSALAVLTVTLSFRLYKNVLQAVQKTQDGHPFKEYLETDVTIPAEKVHEVADLSAARLNAALLELRRLFLVEDLVDSVKFAGILWCLTYVGSWFNGLTLVILGVIGLFSLPKVYETHQEKIDQNLDLVRGKVNEIVDKVQAVLPIGKKPKSQ